MNRSSGEGSKDLKTEEVGQDFPRKGQKNTLKVFPLIFGNEEMIGWQE